jgi:hypothetical protein
MPDGKIYLDHYLPDPTFSLLIITVLSHCGLYSSFVNELKNKLIIPPDFGTNILFAVIISVLRATRTILH